MNKSMLIVCQRAKAEQAFRDYDFDGRVVEAANGWEHDGDSSYTRTVFLENAKDPSADTEAFIYRVSFRKDTTTVVSECYYRK